MLKALALTPGPVHLLLFPSKIPLLEKDTRAQLINYSQI